MSEDMISIPEEFEWMLCALFSKEAYHGAAGHIDAKTWREHLSRLFKYIKKAIAQSVEGDSFHATELENICEETIYGLRNASTCKQLSVTAIQGFTRITFGLIGNFPSHWYKSKAAAAQPVNWKLTRFRTLTYQRTIQQRAAAVIALADDQEFAKRLPSKRELQKKLSEDFKGNERAFWGWFKSSHPDVYVELA